MRDRLDWEAFGTLPGPEKLMLYVDRGSPQAVERCDVAFLWLAWAHVVAATSDDDTDATPLEREHVLGELTHRLMSFVTREDDGGRIDPESLGLEPIDRHHFLLEDGSVVDLATLPGRTGTSRGLYGSHKTAESVTLALLLEAGRPCTIRAQ
jgi:hypothetical protein